MGCTALQTSCKNPGNVSSAVRIPPPGVPRASRISTRSPARARVMPDIASPFGPEPTITASQAESVIAGIVSKGNLARAEGFPFRWGKSFCPKIVRPSFPGPYSFSTPAMINRRRFLATTGAALAAPSFIPNLRAASPNGKVRHVSFGASGKADATFRASPAARTSKCRPSSMWTNATGPESKRNGPTQYSIQDWRELMAKERRKFRQRQCFHARTTCTARSLPR